MKKNAVVKSFSELAQFKKEVRSVPYSKDAQLSHEERMDIGLVVHDLYLPYYGYAEGSDDHQYEVAELERLGVPKYRSECSTKELRCIAGNWEQE